MQILGNQITSKELIEKAKNNASSTEWGKYLKIKILEVADYWVSKSDDELISIIPSGNPRALTPGQYYGDPLTGGNRETLFTSFETPYKWYNPETKIWWYNGAKIVNSLNNQEIVVNDDGNGFIAPEGFLRPNQEYMFIAAYKLFIIGALCGFFYAPVLTEEMYTESSEKKYGGSIPNLAYAYALTDNQIYLKKAAILIGRLAEFYPHMNGTKGDGTHSEGMHWGEISTTESMWLINFFKACDLIWDGIDSSLEKELTDLFMKYSNFFGEKRSKPFSFKESVRLMANESIKTCEIGRSTESDWSLRWIETELHIIVFLRDYDQLKILLYEGEFNLKKSVFNNFYRDGRYHYDSTSYMRIILRQFISIASILEGLHKKEVFPNSINLFNSIRKPILNIVNLNFKVGTGPMLASFGDTVEAENREESVKNRLRSLSEYWLRMDIAAKNWSDSKELFKIHLKGYSKDDLIKARSEKGDFSTLCYAINVENLITTPSVNQKNQRVQYPSNLLEDSSIAYLRSGKTPETRHDLVFWGQPSAAHKHGDKLGIWLGGRGCHLAASGGNYPFTWVSKKGPDWEKHSAACWVVLIDGINQSDSISIVKDYYSGLDFQICSLENHNGYPLGDYRRSIMQINGLNDGDIFILDIFQVSHGYMFDYNTRGTDAGKFEDINFNSDEELRWETMEGSLADDEEPLYKYSGYGWLKSDKQTTTSGTTNFTYKYANNKAGLKVHLISYGKERQIICCYGEKGGYEMKKAPWDPHIIWREERDNFEDHKTQFVTILESIGETPFIKDIEVLKLQNNQINKSDYHPIGLKVIYNNNDYDIIISSPFSSETYSFICENGYELNSDARNILLRYNNKNELRKLEFYRGNLLKTMDLSVDYISELRGIVKEIDYTNQVIEIELKTDVKPYNLTVNDIDGLVGLIFNSNSERESTYYIRNPKLIDNSLVFETDISLIHSLSEYNIVKKQWLKGRPSIEFDGEQVIVDFKVGDEFILPLFVKL